MVGANSSWLFPKSQGHWTHAYDWSGIFFWPFSWYISGYFVPTILNNNSFVQLTQGEKDDKIIAVCADDPEYKHYTDFKELPPHRLSEIRRFFEDCILKKSYSKNLITKGKLLVPLLHVFTF